jgi:hypothetical protein
MRYAVIVLWVLALGCDGGTITVPCDEARCGESCVAEGNESGTCSAEGSCVCRPRLDIPSGATSGLSSGGVVHRSSSGFQVELTIGPVAPAGAGTAGAQEVELGLQAQTDPERTRAP